MIIFETQIYMRVYTVGHYYIRKFGYLLWYERVLNIFTQPHKVLYLISEGKLFLFLKPILCSFTFSSAIRSLCFRGRGSRKTGSEWKRIYSASFGDSSRSIPKEVWIMLMLLPLGDESDSSLMLFYRFPVCVWGSWKSFFLSKAGANLGNFKLRIMSSGNMAAC